MEDFYIAEPEKAFLDTLYMKSKGLVELLTEDVDMDKLDDDIINFYTRLYPVVVKKMVRSFKEHTYEAK